MTGETRILAEFITELRFQDLTSDVVQHTKLCLLDLLGSAIAGARLRPAEMMVGLVKRFGGRPEATIILHEDRVPRPNAALANGVMSHIVEMDDVHREAIIHPGAPVIPSALAVAEEADADGRRLIEAIVVGYEAAIRVGEAVSPSHYRYWHTTGTCGTFGAAAAAGKLLDLDVEGMIDALGTAGTQASGLWQFIEDGAMSKHLHAGKAAYNGVLSALLAAEGFTGAREILEGERGFCRATSQTYDLRRVVEGLGGRLKILETSIKPHASCRHTHPAIDAALTLARKPEFKPDEARRVRVRTYSTAVEIAGNPWPTSPYEAKFSISYCVASALLWGRVGLEEFSHESTTSPEIRGLMEKISVEVDPQLDALYPSRWPAQVEIETIDGRLLKARVDYPLGDPENPISYDGVKAKFRQLASRALHQDRIESIISIVDELEQLGDVGELMELVARTG